MRLLPPAGTSATSTFQEAGSEFVLSRGQQGYFLSDLLRVATTLAMKLPDICELAEAGVVRQVYPMVVSFVR